MIYEIKFSQKRFNLLRADKPNSWIEFKHKNNPFQVMKSFLQKH